MSSSGPKSYSAQLKSKKVQKSTQSTTPRSTKSDTSRFLFIVLYSFILFIFTSTATNSEDSVCVLPEYSCYIYSFFFIYQRKRELQAINDRMRSALQQYESKYNAHVSSTSDSLTSRYSMAGYSASSSAARAKQRAELEIDTSGLDSFDLTSSEEPMSMSYDVSSDLSNSYFTS